MQVEDRMGQENSQAETVEGVVAEAGLAVGEEGAKVVCNPCESLFIQGPFSFGRC